MSLEEFAAGDWIDRLARAIPGLAEAQEPYLGEYWEWNPRVHVTLGSRDGTPPTFPLDDVRAVYARARHSHVFGEAERYAPLCAVLDPVRHILVSHPTLARVVGPIIGRDNFYMQVLNAGHSTSPTDLIAGVMARAAELSGHRFRVAAGERYGRMAAVVGRLAEALARDGRFAVGDRILDVAIALERMYELDQGKISRQLRGRASRYLGTDAASRERIREVVGEFYDARSDIVHNRLEKMTPQSNRVAFGKGFEIARRSLFKLLRDGPPEDWNASRDAGS